MNLVIVGVGKVGETLVQNLIKEEIKQDLKNLSPADYDKKYGTIQATPPNPIKKFFLSIQKNNDNYNNQVAKSKSLGYIK